MYWKRDRQLLRNAEFYARVAAYVSLATFVLVCAMAYVNINQDPGAPQSQVLDYAKANQKLIDDAQAANDAARNATEGIISKTELEDFSNKQLLHQRAIEQTRNLATQTIQQQLHLLEKVLNDDNHRVPTDLLEAMNQTAMLFKQRLRAESPLTNLSEGLASLGSLLRSGYSSVEGCPFAMFLIGAGTALFVWSIRPPTPRGSGVVVAKSEHPLLRREEIPGR